MAPILEASDPPGIELFLPWEADAGLDDVRSRPLQLSFQ